MKGHICYLAPSESIHTPRWINFFAENGWKVDLVTWHPPTSDLKLDRRVVLHHIVFPPHYVGLCGALLELSLMIYRIRPNIIHAHYISTFGILAGLFGQFFRFKPIVMTAWGSDILLDSRGIKKYLVKLALNAADLITCDGKNMIKAMAELGTDTKKISTIYFGTDTKRFRPEIRNQKLRDELEIFDTPMIISTRHLEPLYDVESLIRAIPIVLTQVPNAKFVIIAKSKSQEEMLKNLAKSLGVWKSVRFIGSVSNDNLPKYLASSDIYVSTSLSDAGLAASTAEAMASGLPIVITDTANNEDWVVDGVNGFLVPIRDPQALATGIIRCIENRELAENFGERNRAIIMKRNNYYTEMEKMEKIYLNLLGECNK